MLRQQEKNTFYILHMLDIFLIFFSVAISFFLETSHPGSFFSDGPSSSINENLWIILLTTILWMTLLRCNGLYEQYRLFNMKDTASSVIRAMLIGTLILCTALIISKANYVSRSFVSLFVLITPVLLICYRFAMRITLRQLRRWEVNCRNVLIIGSGKRARTYAEKICSHSEWGLRIVGYIDDQPTDDDREILGEKLIGGFKDVPAIVEKYVVDEVLIALPWRLFSHVQEIAQACEEVGITITFVADPVDTNMAKAHFTLFDGIPLLTFSVTPTRQLQLLFKKGIDFFGAILLLLLLLPLCIIIALLIKITSPGPVLYRQIRCGLNGRRFTMYKFRSMEVNADKKLEMLQISNEMSGPVFKMKSDPRVTRLGYVLRRLSLDELPQLINVVKGEMSLVGPRPPLPEETVQYNRWQRRRLSVKPGLTCLWQVSGRNTLDFSQWMVLDLHYIDHWSLWLDLRILLKTIPAVIRGCGAY